MIKPIKKKLKKAIVFFLIIVFTFLAYSWHEQQTEKQTYKFLSQNKSVYIDRAPFIGNTLLQIGKERIPVFDRIYLVGFSECIVSQEDIATLKKLKHLRQILIDSSILPNSGWNQILEINKLRVVSIHNSHIPDELHSVLKKLKTKNITVYVTGISKGPE